MSHPPGSDSEKSFIEDASAGVILSVKLKPGSARDSIEGINQEGFLDVRVCAPPIKGEANRSLLKLLSASLGVSRNRLSIKSGQTSRRKRIYVEGLTPEDARIWWQGLERKRKAK
jgi:uncharacterized protein (TIGR00251 family)